MLDLNFQKKFKEICIIKKFGSGAPSDKMLDLGILKSVERVFFPISNSFGASNHAGLYANPFANPAGIGNLFLL